MRSRLLWSFSTALEPPYHSIHVSRHQYALCRGFHESFWILFLLITFFTTKNVYSAVRAFYVLIWGEDIGVSGDPFHHGSSNSLASPWEGTVPKLNKRKWGFHPSSLHVSTWYQNAVNRASEYKLWRALQISWDLSSTMLQNFKRIRFASPNWKNSKALSHLEVGILNAALNMQFAVYLSGFLKMGSQEIC